MVELHVKSILIFEETAELSLTWLYYFSFPPAVNETSCCAISLPAFGVNCIFKSKFCLDISKCLSIFNSFLSVVLNIAFSVSRFLVEGEISPAEML